MSSGADKEEMRKKQDRKSAGLGGLCVWGGGGGGGEYVGRCQSN